MTGFNLSEWALRHKSFAVYLMLVSALAGAWSYVRLGSEEDPAFTIKTMIVKTYWPGANTTDTLDQITDSIEKKVEEVAMRWRWANMCGKSSPRPRATPRWASICIWWRISRWW